LLALGSCFFYASWDYRYLALLLAISVIDYWCAAKIASTDDDRRRKLFLTLSVVSNLAILGYFKYYDFFISNLNGLIGYKIPLKAILLPAGISFYTFKSMSYTIDVYRRHIDNCKSQIDYTTFVTFFPELIAGPIVRASVFLPQMSRPIGPTVERIASGASLFLLGLTKKLVIADRLANVADPIFAAPERYSGLTLWMGAIAYSIQIYCDFSGYSDMAIATARMIGYELPENFNMPYLSASVTEFWRRWHITLSSWLRDYLYIPLGGNRHGRARTYFNLFVTMLVGGLWHGASWNFVLWGGMHGVGLAVHRMLGRDTERATIPRWLCVAGTYVFVLVLWVPFRSPSFGSTWLMLRKMFLFSTDGYRWYPELLASAGLLTVAGHVLGTYFARLAQQPSADAERGLANLGIFIERSAISGWHVRLGVATVAASFITCTWALLVFYLAATTPNPFIYFQF
jgi:alginate O-acetyltransferase complex protein AlgI